MLAMVMPGSLEEAVPAATPQRRESLKESPLVSDQTMAADMASPAPMDRRRRWAAE